MNRKVNENSLKPLLDAGWAVLIDRNAVSKTYKFKSFIDAFSFMTSAAIFAEKLNHHPEWTNTYNTLDIKLTTHDADGVTEMDFKLASIINQIVEVEE